MEFGDIFTSDQMQEMTIDELKDVLDYLNIGYRSGSSKSKLISLLNEYQEQQRRLYTDPAMLVPVVMSERVKRITERLKGDSNGR